ncbi:MAG: hypothetical protein JO000_13640 [Alphaproteobacteria bacterium]|nr:hypothetical protein [Alphaproteobacteria bacterium]
MNQPNALTADATSRHAWALGLAGALSLVLGAKLWLIAGYGSSTPFWDEWLEAPQIFRPYLTGELSLGGLVAAHNEHRIVLTRLVALALFAAQGHWDPVAQMLFNAVIHLAALGIFIVMLTRTLDTGRALLLATLVALLFAVPFGWANTVVGFQTQYDLLVLLAPLSLWLLYAASAWSPRWWLGTLLGILSYFSIASGALTFPAFVLLALLQLARRTRKGRAEWLGVLAHAGLAAIILHDIPTVPEHQGIGPSSLAGWIGSVGIVASWPVSKTSWPLLALVPIALGLYAPVMLLAWRLVAARAPVRDSRWLLVALAGWSALQLLAFVYGRGAAVLQSRYYDILMLAPLVSAAALLCAQQESAARWRRAATAFACVWFAAVIIGFGQKALDDLPTELQWRQQTSEAQTRNLKTYLASGDFGALQNKPELDVPYPDIAFLRDTVSDPVIRAILPPELLGKSEPDIRLKTRTLRYGRLLMPIGLALLVIAALLMMARREGDDPLTR